MTRPKEIQCCLHQIGALCSSVVLLFSIGCGGGTTNTGGSGGETPPPPPAITKEWTWVGGSNTAVTTTSVYGTKGVAAAGNNPNSWDGVSWVDSSGDLWLFGGAGIDPLGTMGAQNDLWEYNPTSNEWTWVGGCGPTPCNKLGVYGSEGTPSATNLPGGRVVAVSWIDTSGNLWLFGGQGYDSMGQGYYLNDLWEYSIATKHGPGLVEAT